MKNLLKIKQDTINFYFNKNIKIYKDIVLFKKFIPEEKIKLILSDYDLIKDWKFVPVDSQERKEQTTKIFFVENEHIDKLLLSITKDLLDIYSVFYPEVQLLISGDQGYRYNLYENGKSYYNHIDCSKLKPKLRQRVISCVIQLNSDYNGGILNFPNQNFKIKLNAGDIVLFPSIHTHPHFVSPVVSGVRKNLVTWFT